MSSGLNVPVYEMSWFKASRCSRRLGKSRLEFSRYHKDYCRYSVLIKGCCCKGLIDPN